MSGRHNAKHPVDNAVETMSESAVPAEPVRDEPVVTGFDQTNGVVDGLEGDDDGAITPESERGADSPLHSIVSDVVDGDDAQPESGQTPYSEEGRM